MEVGRKGGGGRKRGSGREEGESTVRCVWGRGWEGARRATIGSARALPGLSWCRGGDGGGNQGVAAVLPSAMIGYVYVVVVLVVAAAKVSVCVCVFVRVLRGPFRLCG